MAANCLVEYFEFSTIKIIKKSKRKLNKNIIPFVTDATGFLKNIKFGKIM